MGGQLRPQHNPWACRSLRARGVRPWAWPGGARRIRGNGTGNHGEDRQAESRPADGPGRPAHARRATAAAAGHARRDQLGHLVVVSRRTLGGVVGHLDGRRCLGIGLGLGFDIGRLVQGDPGLSPVVLGRHLDMIGISGDVLGYRRRFGARRRRIGRLQRRRHRRRCDASGCRCLSRDGQGRRAGRCGRARPEQRAQEAAKTTARRGVRQRGGGYVARIGAAAVCDGVRGHRGGAAGNLHDGGAGVRRRGLHAAVGRHARTEDCQVALGIAHAAGGQRVSRAADRLQLNVACGHLGQDGVKARPGPREAGGQVGRQLRLAGHDAIGHLERDPPAGAGRLDGLV